MTEKDTTPSRPTQGLEPPLRSAAERAEALRWAVDYRGDVTLHLADGRVLEGYVFDLSEHASPPSLRVMLKEGGRIKVACDEVTRLVFSGRDTADGRSWETWVRKYLASRAAGQRASIEADTLEE